MDTYRYSATVNGERRWVILTAPSGLSGDEVINLVDNDEKAYTRFYRGAAQGDYDAEREDELVEVYGWREVER